MLRLREERQRRGLSQTKLSGMTGIASTDISAIENGWKKPFPGWKKRIARALGVHGTEAERLFEEVRQ
jgi:ribosome-binding protein aMBF1 (putative translation factor)